MSDQWRSQWAARVASGVVAVLVLCLPCEAQTEGAAPLSGLSNEMEQAGGLLRRGITGEEVSSVQRRVVWRLDELIAFYEQEGSGDRVSSPVEGEPKSPRPSGATAEPVRPAEESVLPAGPWSFGRLRSAGAPSEAWLPGLPDRERTKVADTFRAGRLPPRYRELLRQYNVELARDQGR